MKSKRAFRARFGSCGSRTGAAIYTIVVFNALLVGVLGLSALSIVRIERKQSLASSDQLIARENAASAVAVALARIKADAGWRSTFTHNAESAAINFGTGSATWRLVDMVDTSLSNNARHGVFVDGIGRSGSATWVERVEAYQPEVPLPTLACAIHSKGRLQIDGGHWLTVVNGTASTNGELKIDGALVGNGQCNTRTGGGAVIGTVTTGLAARESPASSTLFTTYRDQSTALTYVGSLNHVLLGPGANTYSGLSTNPDGMYYINSGSSTLNISGSRIQGTLVVKGNVQVNDHVFLQFNKREAPVLIVDGNLTVNCDSSLFLSEADEGRNFNPATSLFQGSGDLDTTDVYPSEIWGLVHVTGNVTFVEPTRIVGMMLVDGEVRISDQAVIQADPTIFFSPPTGYWTANPGPLVAKPTKWQRAAVQ
jgi:hypothetical protein